MNPTSSVFEVSSSGNCWDIIPQFEIIDNSPFPPPSSVSTVGPSSLTTWPGRQTGHSQQTSEAHRKTGSNGLTNKQGVLDCKSVIGVRQFYILLIHSYNDDQLLMVKYNDSATFLTLRGRRGALVKPLNFNFLKTISFQIFFFFWYLHNKLI